jgi:hypothetical protein
VARSPTGAARNLFHRRLQKLNGDRSRIVYFDDSDRREPIELGLNPIDAVCPATAQRSSGYPRGAAPRRRRRAARIPEDRPPDAVWRRDCDSDRRLPDSLTRNPILTGEVDSGRIPCAQSPPPWIRRPLACDSRTDGTRIRASRRQ